MAHGFESEQEHHLRHNKLADEFEFDKRGSGQAKW
jgi:hypothetical protein